MAELRCSRCGSDLGPDGPGQRIASISGSILGDECTETWYHCSGCNAYTVEIYWDVFLGEDSVSIRGPIAREDGNGQIALIHSAPPPGSRPVAAPHIARISATSWTREGVVCTNPAG